MKSPGTPPTPPGAPECRLDEKETGLPGLRSWRAVYVFVLAAFVVWVLLLTALTELFS